MGRQMIEGFDYYVYYVSFPNYANKGAARINDDGTYTVYVNTKYPSCMYPEILKHELRHITGDDFYDEDLDILEAEGLD